MENAVNGVPGVTKSKTAYQKARLIFYNSKVNEVHIEDMPQGKVVRDCLYKVMSRHNFGAMIHHRVFRTKLVNQKTQIQIKRVW